MRAEAAGVLSTPASAALPDRLAELQLGIRALLAELRPDAVAVERVFFQSNVRTAMSIGQASGVILAEAVNAGCSVVEYTPTQVKSSV
ncbi:MAG: ruvC, partial [Actinomycetia bacterium]|nr:ruvC [Actinomycetes bacterium]